MLLAGAPWWLSCCWPVDATERDAAGRVHRGGFVGQGAKEVLLAEGTVAKRMTAPW